MPFTGYATPVATQHYVTPAGQRISQFSGYVPAGSVLTPNGYDVEWEDGTVGRAQVPFTTLEQATEYARKWNKQRVAAYTAAGQAAPALPTGAPT
jgi:hypothetical protein